MEFTHFDENGNAYGGRKVKKQRQSGKLLPEEAFI